MHVFGKHRLHFSGHPCDALRGEQFSADRAEYGGLDLGTCHKDIVIAGLPTSVTAACIPGVTCYDVVLIAEPTTQEAG